MKQEKISKKEAKQYFIEKLNSRKGTINLTNNDILDVYLTRSFYYPVDSYYNELIEKTCIELIDVFNNYPGLEDASEKNVKRIKLSFIAAVDEELLELINYEECNISLQSFIELLPFEVLVCALEDINNDIKPTLTKIYVVVDKICKNKNGKTYTKNEINKCIMKNYKNCLEIAEHTQNKYEEDYIIVQEESKKEKKSKYSFEPYYNKNEIDDYGDDTEYPTDIINSRTILK